MTPDLLTRVETIERRLHQARAAYDAMPDTPSDVLPIFNSLTDLAFLCAEVRRQQGIIQAVEAVCARCEPIDAGTNDVVDRTIRAITSSIRRALSSAEAT